MRTPTTTPVMTTWEIPKARADAIVATLNAARAVLREWIDPDNPKVTGWDRHGTFLALRDALEALDGQ